MSDKATTLRETVEAFADLRTMDTLIHIPYATPRGSGDRASQAAESLPNARSFWAPGSFWRQRHPHDRDSRDMDLV